MTRLTFALPHKSVGSHIGCVVVAQRAHSIAEFDSARRVAAGHRLQSGAKSKAIAGPLAKLMGRWLGDARLLAVDASARTFRN